MKPIGIFILLVATSSPALSKTQYFLRATPTSDQKEEWLKGIQGVSVPSRFGEVYVLFPRRRLPDQQSNFVIGIQNFTGKTVTIAPENVTIEVSGQKTMAMLQLEDLEGRARRDQKRRSFFSSLGAVIAAGNADGSVAGTFNGTASSYGENFHMSGTYSGYDAALAAQQRQAVREQVERNGLALAARATNSQQALSGMLQKTTVQPKQLYGGIVAFDPPRNFSAMRPTIVITIEGEQFRFPAVIHATEN